MMWIAIITNFVQLVLLSTVAHFKTAYPETAQKHRVKMFYGCVAGSVLVLIFATYSANRQQEQQRLVLDSITGGDAFPVVVPGATTDSAMLWIRNFGDSSLSGVTVSMGCDSGPFTVPELVGTIPAHGAIRLRENLNLKACREQVPMTIAGGAVAGFVFQMSAQNGTYTERLQFRTGKPGCTGIAIRSWVEKIGGVRYTKDHKYVITDSEDAARVYTSSPDPNIWGGSENCPGEVPRPKPAGPPRIAGH
jgi:hypothetical protein